MLSIRLFVSRSVWFVAAAFFIVWGCSDGGSQNPDDGGKNDPVTGVDTIPPANVLGLVVRNPKASGLSVVWFSPGDDGQTGQAAAYDLRYSLTEINGSNWDAATRVSGLPAPKPANSVETVDVYGLPSEEDIYFALKTKDEAGNESGLSNCAFGTTLDMAPAFISDLKARAISDTEFLLTWSATGDDDTLRTASFYDVRYSIANITENNWYRAEQAEGEGPPSGPGEPDSFLVTGLSPNTNYYFAVKIGDEVPNWSLLSNVSPAFAFGVDLWVTPTYVDPGGPVQITYGSSPTEQTRVLIYQQFMSGYPPVYFWQIVRRLVGGYMDGDVYNTSWDGRDDDGELIASHWGELCCVKLVWGGAVVDSMLVRIGPATE